MALSPAAIQRGLFLFLCLVWGTNWLAMKAGTAEVPPEQIYEGGDGSFEFARTVSRLIEMQSSSYLDAD